MKNQEKMSIYREDLQTRFPQLLATHLTTERGFETSIPKEAHKFYGSCDVVLMQGVSTLTIACILDRTNHLPHQGTRIYEKAIKLVQQALLSLDNTASLKKLNDIQIYEFGRGPLSVSEKLHLRELAEQVKSLKGMVTYFYIDIENGDVWTNSKQSKVSDIYELLTIWAKNPEQPVLPQLRAKFYFPFLTLGICVLLMLIFGLEVWNKLNPLHEELNAFQIDPYTMIAMGGIRKNEVQMANEWYRLLTSTFLHGGLPHLLLNCMGFCIVGFILERYLGASWTLLLFVISSLGGALFSLGINPEHSVAVGASGAIMGLFSAAIILALHHPPGAKRNKILKVCGFFLIPSLLPLPADEILGEIDHAAHLGGAFFGAFAGFLLLMIWPQEQRIPYFSNIAKGFAGIVASLLIISGVMVKQKHGSYVAEYEHLANIEDYLIESEKIPSDLEQAIREVDEWSKDYPHDPRTHLYRALHLRMNADDDSTELAKKELQAALNEDFWIIKHSFTNGIVESYIRGLLCEILLEQGQKEQAREIARPVCKRFKDDLSQGFLDMGLCDNF